MRTPIRSRIDGIACCMPRRVQIDVTDVSGVHGRLTSKEASKDILGQVDADLERVPVRADHSPRPIVLGPATDGSECLPSICGSIRSEKLRKTFITHSLSEPRSYILFDTLPVWRPVRPRARGNVFNRKSKARRRLLIRSHRAATAGLRWPTGPAISCGSVDP